MDDYDRRMQNWARWRRGGAAALVKRNSPLAFTLLSQDIYNRTDSRNREAMSPLLVGEAEDTQRAVEALPPGLRRVVEVWHLERGPKSLKARMCGCRQRAMFDRLAIARGLLLNWMAEYRVRMRSLNTGSCTVPGLVSNSTAGTKENRIPAPLGNGGLEPCRRG